ncbi:hypothetical protein DFJ58DRAFT_845861, partial [Suillus subalutaceus]|uniref:uncharacterized protein n=1 Tax=Suillus subalutaceus TaxID=48586 RepID=UPI001B878261
MSTASINSMQWLDLATNIKNTTTISFTLEAQFVFQKSVSSSTLCTSKSTTQQIIPGDGISEPAIIITTEKSPYLRDPRRELEDATMSHMIKLLEEIFASGLADHVHKKAFTRGWTKLVVPAACHTQNSADNRNIFQLGSCASLPFPPPSSVTVPRGAAASHSQLLGTALLLVQQGVAMEILPALHQYPIAIVDLPSPHMLPPED